MPKKRDKSETEFYKGKVRELQKKNRQLEKKVRQLEKTEHMFEEALIADYPVEYEIIEKKKVCLECGKGKITEINVLDRIFEECDICDYRRKIRGP